MQKFKTVCAQGDIYVRKIDALPKGTISVAPERGHLIIAHSETGHHHVMNADDVIMHRLPDSIMDCFLVVKKPTALRHLRPHDTHEPIVFEPGVYHVKRQREHTPQGWKRITD